MAPFRWNFMTNDAHAGDENDCDYYFYGDGDFTTLIELQNEWNEITYDNCIYFMRNAYNIKIFILMQIDYDLSQDIDNIDMDEHLFTYGFELQCNMWYCKSDSIDFHYDTLTLHEHPDNVETYATVEEHGVNRFIQIDHDNKILTVFYKIPKQN